MKEPRQPFGVKLPRRGEATLLARRPSGDVLDAGLSRDALVCFCETRRRKFVHPDPVGAAKASTAVEFVFCLFCVCEHRLCVPPGLREARAARGG